ncbi:MAG: hybrid sensor histidine kinase/response regulator [Candidatus Dadabacteria bacterium]|nr:MAG: hybrid sensor histidine kinase/response regulator [Candidatus Dadabacteria bacterium]
MQKILLVEDNRIDAKLVSSMLKKHPETAGAEVICAERLNEAINFLKNESFDLILLDLHLPDSRDQDVVSLIHNEASHTPIIVLTGTADQDKNALQKGAEDYLVKTRFDSAQLAKSIRFAVERHGNRNLLLKKTEALENLKNELEDSNRVLMERLAAIEALREMVVITDADGTIRYANKAATKITGYGQEDLIGANPNIFKSGKHDDSFYEELWSTILSGQNWQGEITNRRKDGTTYEAHLSITPLTDTSGTVTSFIGISRDITEEKKRKLQLEQIHRFESVGQLAAGIAHEINTPLQYIGDNANYLENAFNELKSVLKLCQDIANMKFIETPAVELAKEALKIVHETQLDAKIEEIPRALKDIKDGVHMASEITRATLRFVHPRSDASEPVLLSEAIENVIKISKNRWKDVAEIKTCFPEQLPEVNINLVEFNQVILNLVVNAADAIREKLEGTPGEKGEIKIDVKLEENNISIAITDTGTGIPPEIIERIYDPFFTTKEIGKGTGQGLSVVHAAVTKSLGGSISVESTPGEGTTFNILIPITQTQATEEQDEN